jgi:hypothetical protein
MVLLAADWYVGVFRGHLWTAPATSAPDATSRVGPAVVVLGASALALGLTIAVESAGLPGVLLGLLLAVSGLSRLLRVVRRGRRTEAP